MLTLSLNTKFSYEDNKSLDSLHTANILTHILTLFRGRFFLKKHEIQFKRNAYE